MAIGCLNGSILIVDPKTLVITFTFKDRDKSVSCIKFSPEGDLLAVAYHYPCSEVIKKLNIFFFKYNFFRKIIIFFYIAKYIMYITS